MKRWVRHLSLWELASSAPRWVITRWLTFWGVGVVSAMSLWATWRMFGGNPPDIGMGAAAAYGTLLGAGVGGAVAFYKWARESEDRDERKEIRDDGSS